MVRLWIPKYFHVQDANLPPFLYLFCISSSSETRILQWYCEVKNLLEPIISLTIGYICYGTGSANSRFFRNRKLFFWRSCTWTYRIFSMYLRDKDITWGVAKFKILPSHPLIEEEGGNSAVGLINNHRVLKTTANLWWWRSVFHR